MLSIQPLESERDADKAGTHDPSCSPLVTAKHLMVERTEVKVSEGSEVMTWGIVKESLSAPR